MSRRTAFYHDERCLWHTTGDAAQQPNQRVVDFQCGLVDEMAAELAATGPS